LKLTALLFLVFLQALHKRICFLSRFKLLALFLGNFLSEPLEKRLDILTRESTGLQEIDLFIRNPVGAL